MQTGKMFKALVLETGDAAPTAATQDLDEALLPHGDVSVAIDYSTVNYKDGLVISGAAGFVKRYPHVPGIDFAGAVLSSSHPRYRTGDKVILSGWRVGETRWGGLAQRAVVDGDWLVPLPEGLTTRQSMAIGTAGFTAMLAVMALEAHGVTPADGDVLVTGAAGGVGSVATALLAKLGFQVIASTGRAEAKDYLLGLGASSVIDRSAFTEPARRLLEAERWSGCIDSVGGTTLARVLAQTRYGGSVAAVGLAGGSKLEHSVVPFILRGVNLLGIDSVMCPMDKRLQAWTRLQSDLPLDQLDAMTVTATLDEVPRLAGDILKGRIRGRIVVDVNS